MSNPVPPPGGAYPPPPAQGQPGYPAQGQPGYPAQGGVPGQPVPGQPAAPGAGYPPPPPLDGQPPQFGAFPTEQKKSRKGRKIFGSIGGIVIAIIIAIVVSVGHKSLNDVTDKAKEAKAGDCVKAQGDVPKEDGKTTDAEAAVVDCTSSDAAYKVLGRVPGETDTNSKSCDKYFTDQKSDYFVYSSTTNGGYLLCLQALKAS